MTNRPKIKLTFFLGKLHDWAPTDWYLLIDQNSFPFVENIQIGTFARAVIANPHFKGIEHPMALAEKINMKNAIAHSSGKMLDCIAQRTGGYCSRLHAVYATKIVEIKPFETWADPIRALFNVWPVFASNLAALEESAQISQYCDGTHYYARLANGEDVEVDGRRKWDTWGQAKSAVRAYIANLAIRAAETSIPPAKS